MAPAVPCKTCKKYKHGETRSNTDDFKSKFACILEASESTRMRTEETRPKDEARTKGIKVHFASLMDTCHLKNAELETKAPKYKGRVVLRGDIVKDDSGSHAVFPEQGSSASQMTAAKVMDIISRLPGCAGQAADAVSACTQVKMADAPKSLKIPKSECPDIWTRVPRHKWPKSWSSMEDPVVFFLKGICTVILWQDHWGKGNLRKCFWNMAARKFQIGNVSLYIMKKDYSYLCMWMT